MRTLRSLIGTFVSLSLLLALALSPAFAQPAFDPPGLERAIEAQERHTNDLLGIQGVVGTAVGHGAQGRAAIFVYTVKPGVVGIPTELDGVPVATHVTGKIFAFPKPDKGGKPPKNNGKEVDPKGRFSRPVPIGVSSGNVELFVSDGNNYCSVGTLGARVTDGTDVYARSNNHVYAHANSASIGDTIVQPGTVDIDPVCSNNSDPDSIGVLYAFKPLKFDGSPNYIDAAIALSSTGDLGNATPSDGYGTPTSTTVSAVINAKLEKYGGLPGRQRPSSGR